MYELVGFSNLLDIDCGFMFPVFSKESKLFFQDSNDLIINNFFEANEERISKCYYSIDSSNGYYDEGTGAVFAFLLSREPVNYIFGSAVEVRNKLDNYLPFVNNQFIKDDINDFIHQVDNCRKKYTLTIYNKNDFLAIYDIYNEIINALFYDIIWSETAHCSFFVSSSQKKDRVKIIYKNYVDCYNGRLKLKPKKNNK